MPSAEHINPLSMGDVHNNQSRWFWRWPLCEIDSKFVAALAKGPSTLVGSIDVEGIVCMACSGMSSTVSCREREERWVIEVLSENVVLTDVGTQRRVVLSYSKSCDCYENEGLGRMFHHYWFQ